jgi:cation:H+ antiporter
MVISIFLLIIGFGLLIFGAEWLVSGSVNLARIYKVPELTVGLTIVAFGTSTPELVVSIIGAAQAHPDVALGNVIGSNNFNLFLILGLAAILQPIKVQHSTVWKEIPFSILAALALWVFGNNYFQSPTSSPTLDRFEGIVLLVFFAGFICYIRQSLIKDQNQPLETEPSEKEVVRSVKWSLIRIIVGLATLVGGGDLVVSKAMKLATELNIEEGIIGLTIVAVGTSLPELATTLVAALRNKADLAVGNIIGSNIFNILLILGISSTISPLAFSPSYNREMYLLFGGTAILFIAMFTGGKHSLDRWEAFVLLAAFLLYVYYAYGGGELLLS